MSGREQLVDAYLRLHPEKAARLLESMPVDQANAVLSAVDATTAAPVVSHMLPTHAARCLEQQPPVDSALLLEKLGSQESVAVLRHLPGALREEVLGSLGPQWLMAFKLLLSYPTNTIGAWVEPRVLTLPDDCNCGEARERIARSDQVNQARIYVLDRSRRLRGAVRGLTLLQVPHRKSLASILEPAEALWARDLLVTAQDHGIWERYTEAPVVNRDEEFIGVITYADLRRAYRQSLRGNGARNEREIAEVTELIAIGAGSLWKSLGDLMGTDRQR
ncbi:MAG TPA: CBS domain-containing protein [Gammaproteobacteria bacterium]|nr:CBS domain-containing protein [Gammaproteobacteria bacterium]